MAIDVTAKADLTALLERARQTAQLLDEMGLESDRQTVEELIIALGGNLDEDNAKETPAPAVAPEPQPLPKAPASANERDYYTTTEAASLIHVSAQTIRNWVARGAMKGYQLGGRIVIPRPEIDPYRHIHESLDMEPIPPLDWIIEATSQPAGKLRPWDKGYWVKQNAATSSSVDQTSEPIRDRRDG